MLCLIVLICIIFCILHHEHTWYRFVVFNTLHIQRKSKTNKLNIQSNTHINLTLKYIHTHKIHNYFQFLKQLHLIMPLYQRSYLPPETVLVLDMHSGHQFTITSIQANLSKYPVVKPSSFVYNY